MLSPNNTGSKVHASSIWSFDSGYDTSRAVSPSVQAQAPSDVYYHTPKHTPVIFNRDDFWNAPVGRPAASRDAIGLTGTPQSECDRVREDSLVDPITTQLNVFTTRDTPNHNFVLPEIPAFDRSCLQCEVWQLTNPGQHNKCQKCQAHTSHETLPTTAEPLPTNKDGLPRLDIPRGMQGKGLKRLRSPSRCSVCEVSLIGASKYCSNCLPGHAHHSPLSPSSPEYPIKRSRAGRNSKLPIAALNRLQAWLDANRHNPYPTAETKRSLAQECGITEKQVNTWFTNARARQMSAHQVESGSEVEGAEDSDDAEPPQANIGISAYLQNSDQSEQTHRRTSIASQSRTRPSRRGKKKNYRQTHNADVPQTPLLPSPASNTSPIDQSISADQEMWQCTFCLKALVPKSWRRHEDTQHRPKAQAARWTCMLHGPRLSFPNRTNSGSVCAFCMVKNPSEEHFLQNHRIDECSRRDATDRTYYRPDHLRQHIKQFHNATLFDIVQARWKTAAETVAEGWTCGFCGDRLETWDKRETHISNHFKDGMTMASWREHPDMEKKTDKKKAKGKEKEMGNMLGGIRIGNPFRRPNSSHHHAQPQPQPQTQNNIFANSFQSLPVAPQNQTHAHGYQTTAPHCTSTGYQNAYTSSAPMGLGISQAPVLPEIPTVSPLMVTQHELDPVSNYIDWTTIPDTFNQQLQYPLPQTNTYEAGVPTVTMQPDFSNALALGLYGNPIEYQGPWEPQHPSPPHNMQQYPQQHPQRRQR